MYISQEVIYYPAQTMSYCEEVLLFEKISLTESLFLCV